MLKNWRKNVLWTAYAIQKGPFCQILMFYFSHSSNMNSKRGTAQTGQCRACCFVSLHDAFAFTFPFFLVIFVWFEVCFPIVFLVPKVFPQEDLHQIVKANEQVWVRIK